MFYSIQNLTNQKEYQKFLQVVGSLSNLFSESNTPYLYYRIAEKIFCKAFNAEALSRSDVSVDSKKEMLGIGLKTFLAGNNKKFQKITEFGSADRVLSESLSLQKKIEQVLQVEKLLENKVDVKYYYNDKPLYEKIKDDVNNPESIYQWRLS